MPGEWIPRSLFSENKESGGECTHKKIKDKQEKRIEDERIKGRAKKAYKDSYEILEEGCDSHSIKGAKRPHRKEGGDTV